MQKATQEGEFPASQIAKPWTFNHSKIDSAEMPGSDFYKFSLSLCSAVAATTKKMNVAKRESY